MTTILATLLLGTTPLAADQGDARLDPLFEQLRLARDVDRARALEASIWHIWLDSGKADVNGLVRQGLRAMAVGDLDRALAAFDRVVEKAPGFAEGWNKRATVHYLLGNYSASVVDIHRTLDLEPRHFGALSGMGLILEAVGDEAGALEAFQDALRIHPQAEGTRDRVRRLRTSLYGELI